MTPPRAIGRRLQGRAQGAEGHLCVRTRIAKVSRPLMAVTGMVDQGHAVVFDSAGSYALNKKTGRKIPFARHAGGWNMEMELEPPARANDLTKQQLAELYRRGPQPERYGVAEFHDEIAEIEEPRPGRRTWHADLKSACAPGPFGRPGGLRL